MGTYCTNLFLFLVTQEVQVVAQTWDAPPHGFILVQLNTAVGA